MMGKFLEYEKERLAKFKTTSYFSIAARAEGIYKRKPRQYCLPFEHAEENLFSEIRQSAPAYFAHPQYGIKWHDGQNRKPSNHLCDSQVCCVNFLFPFADKPKELAEVLRPVFPDLQEMLKIANGQYVAFEWIGQCDYLGEKIQARNKRRSRGANCTSTDAAVKFARTDGKRQIVLIEWKYTESYSSVFLKIARSKRRTDRTLIYQPLYLQADCPINKNLLPSFDSLFYEPFYQLMRQQFLAHEMEKAHELGADVVSVLHIAPERNTDFRKVTSPELQSPGKSATEVWGKLARPHDKFIRISAERLFGNLSVEQLPKMQMWLDYIRARYAWIREDAVSA